MLLECDGFSTDTQLCARRHRKRGADAVSACSALNRIHSVKAHELKPVIGLKTVLGQPLSHTNVTPLLTPLSGHMLILQDLSYTQTSLSLRRHAHGPLAKRLMHMVHFSGNTSGVSKSSSDWLNYTGFPGDVCVAFFNVPRGNKDAVAPKPLVKEESRCVYKCDEERLD